ncbi:MULTISPECIES: ATP-binding cassette domain-containing protein, partial [unclassified Microcoleus]|uniref:ATP-binding cassette domain-containing protein n=1 Tax=unclassified Microcoleus TaxID=2642155 RepID=UPI004040B42D
MIEVEHLSKTYGSTAAIADVSFSVESGEILGFLGPNGAGKTTTMRILSGYLPASSGTARIAGLDVHENSMAVRQRIGYLPENPPLYPEMTVEGFLFFVARIKQVPAGDRARRVTSAIERCGLVDKRKVLIRKLSKGFRQRVGIAQAIVHDPPVIILDEPTVGLDPRQIIEVRNLIKSLGGQHTIILSTHILPEVSMTCNRVTIINRGKIAAAGTPENLMGELAVGEGYELEVEGEADLVNSLLLPSLENVPGVRSVELIPSQQFLASRYRLRALCEPDIEPGREIATAIITSGFGLCEMRRNRASLEDVFLRLTAAEKKPEENLVHSEPEVDRNLQEATEIQDSIADSHQSESQPIVENLIVSDRQESIEHPQPEPIVENLEVSETLESIEHPQPEPIIENLLVVETQESIEHPQPASEPVVETLESIEHPQPAPIVEHLEVSETLESSEHPQPEPIIENLLVVETQESIDYSQPESQPVAETPEEISDLEPEMQPVADFLETVERQESIEHPQPEPVVEKVLIVETVESKEHPQPEPEPIVETVESSEHPQPEPEPIVETVESSEHPQPEPIVENFLIPETVESSERSQPEPEPILETVESSEHPQPEPIVENLLIVETVESKERSQPEPEPILETVESREHPQPEPIVENLLIVERQESKEPSQPEPIVENLLIVETVESSERSQPEPIVENLLIVQRQESSEHSQPEPIVENLLIVETVESSEHSQPEPIVENLLIVETVESSERSQPE